MREGSIRLYIDQSERPDMDTEIYMDASLTHYPLRDYKGLWAEMNNIVKGIPIPWKAKQEEG